MEVVVLQDSIREDELQHYGVIGMKWGVRRNPSKAYGRAMVKKKKIDDRVSDSRLKGSKLQYKAEKLRQKATTMKKLDASNKKMLQANKLLLDAAKQEAKGRKWMNSVDKAFKDYTIKKLPEGNIKAGKNFVYRKIYGDDKYKVTKNPE